MTFGVTGPNNRVTTTVASFLGNLPELLGVLQREGDKTLVVVSFQGSKYVQFIVRDEIFAEVVSNTFLDGDEGLTVFQEAVLRELDFSAPCAPNRPNWYYVERTASNCLVISAKIATVLLHIFNCAPNDVVTIQTWKG